MIKSFDDIVPGKRYLGITADGEAKILEVQPQGENDAIVAYRCPNGKLDEKILSQADLSNLQECSEQRWSFDADGANFRLASEAKRMQNAHLVDPFAAVDTSNIDPYPHQIEAVYQRLLNQQPLRFLLADDPGAGKTIMSGLLIRELMLRGDVSRCLIVAPGNLVEQWQAELATKFSLEFEIFNRENRHASRVGNPFEKENFLLARMDQLARNKYLIEDLQDSEWDLVIVDEAHKMSAPQYGVKVKRTKRYQLGEKLRDCTRHFLLLTATPHDGKVENFNNFMRLLDPERFEGRLRQHEEPVVNDLMRRYVKENLTTFEGKRIFPKREATTLHFSLSPQENALYVKVTDYVREGVKAAARMRQAGNWRVGIVTHFALIGLQRRLASSPAAIHESLKRRHQRLSNRAREFNKHLTQPLSATEVPEGLKQLKKLDDIDYEDYSDQELEDYETEAIEVAMVSETLTELQQEIKQLEDLLQLAKAVRDSGEDTKWRELRQWLRSEEFRSSNQKLIIFSEYLDTLEYIANRVAGELGSQNAVVTIHGGLQRQSRRNIQDKFINVPAVKVLVATDAAGEGVNLQVANKMVNYDLPWNPNRIEQRFGRIHRIGQERPCYLYNLVAHETREGQVFTRLFEKIEQQRKTFGDQVYDILGATVINKSLPGLLLDAITSEASAVHQEYMEETIEKEIGKIGDQMKSMLEERALVTDFSELSSNRAIRRQMEEAKVYKLQPNFVRAFFTAALEQFGGSIAEREQGCYEIARVPYLIRQLANPAKGAVHERYKRVTFDKALINSPKNNRPLPLANALATASGTPPVDSPKIGPALLVAPGTALLDAVVNSVLSRYEATLKKGAILVDADDLSTDIRLLLYFEHTITDGREQPGGDATPASKRFLYVEIDREGRCKNAGLEPYLGYSPIEDNENDLLREQIATQVDLSWADEAIENEARKWVIEKLANRHFQDVSKIVKERVEKVRAAVKQRLESEILYWDKRAQDLMLDEKAGRTRAGRLTQALQRADELEHKLDTRLDLLEKEETLSNHPPVVVSAAMIVPQGLLDRMGGKSWDSSAEASRMETDRRAMEAVMEAEKNLGRIPEVQSHSNPGYDILSRDPADETYRFVEVKGYLSQTTEISVSAQQVQKAKTNPNSWILAVVAVPSELSGKPSVRYLKEPFKDTTMHFAQSRLSLSLNKLLPKATKPC